MRRRNDPNQTLINWIDPTAAGVAPAGSILDPVRLAAQAQPPMIERLPWDFSTTFPQPTDQAIDAGIIDELDFEPANLRALHDNYARECLANLQQFDTVLDARRCGVDPETGKGPKSHRARERLRKLFTEEPERLERAFHIQMEEYENAFGPVAAHAFNRFIRARHAGIPVEIDPSAKTECAAAQIPLNSNGLVSLPEPQEPRRRNHPGSSSLPVPRPRAKAVKAGHFGIENGKPINPTRDEVRAIMGQRAEKIIALLDGRRQMERSYTSPQCSDRTRVGAAAASLKDQIRHLIDECAEDFSEQAAEQLERYCRRHVTTGRSPRTR